MKATILAVAMIVSAGCGRKTEDPEAAAGKRWIEGKRSMESEAYKAASCRLTADQPDATPAAAVEYANTLGHFERAKVEAKACGLSDSIIRAIVDGETRQAEDAREKSRKERQEQEDRLERDAKEKQTNLGLAASMRASRNRVEKACRDLEIALIKYGKQDQLIIARTKHAAEVAKMNAEIEEFEKKHEIDPPEPSEFILPGD